MMASAEERTKSGLRWQALSLSVRHAVDCQAGQKTSSRIFLARRPFLLFSFSPYLKLHWRGRSLLVPRPSPNWAQQTSLELLS